MNAIPAFLLAFFVVTQSTKGSWSLVAISFHSRAERSVARVQLKNAEETKFLELILGDYEQGIDDAFISASGQLVVIAKAPNLDVAYFFDIPGGSRKDWFYCSRPVGRISNRILLFSRGQPLHGDIPSDVVLAYDLSKPVANKSQFDRGASVYPLPDDPRFPTREGSWPRVYVNGRAGFLELPKDRFAFAALDTDGTSQSKNSLVIVDIRRGLTHPRIKEIPFPETSPEGEDLRPLTVDRIEFVSPNEVLVFPLGFPNVDHIRFDLPPAGSHERPVPPVVKDPLSRSEHLKIPNGFDYIRVGREVQKDLLTPASDIRCKGDSGDTVDFEVLLDAGGNVMRFVALSGSVAAIQRAETIVPGCSYKPTSMNGKPIPVLTRLRVSVP